jgi:acyl transferase domain-containing protein/acyl carrier protein
MAAEEKTLAYLKRVTGELLQSRRQQQALEEQQHAPIAIVGMSCRYPGGVVSPDGLWDLLSCGREGIGGFPTDRGWDLEALYDPDPDNRGTTYMREGGFLADAQEFDARFFDISPREALAMDPQQRLLLEGVWEALEDGGIDPLSLRGSQTGVFAGVSSSGYAAGRASAEGLDGYLLTGNTASVVAGRVAYVLGLQGPTFSVDTACSSSLVALDCACQALRGERCSLALVGGVTVMASPEALVEFCAQGASSPDGRCKSFSQAADGAGWSEGVGVLLLARLSDALQDGLRVLAVVKGSAVNHDGASNGLTAPNGPSQQRVITQALADARLQAAQIDALEAHGTGTVLGDPIEAQALLATYGNGRERPLWLGSLKSNIGHSVAAAGVGGVIKMVMALRHGVLPRTLHVEEPSSQIDWSDGRLSLLREEVEWKRNRQPRRAGVSSFGISGTNAHVILEEAPAPIRSLPAAGVEVGEASGVADESVVAWLVSGRSEGALIASAERLRVHLRSCPGLGVEDVAFTLAAGRAQFEQRAAVVGSDREELLEGLDVLARGGVSDRVLRGVSGRAGKVCFAFPGQGCQWVGMGLELAESSPVFARRLRECGEALGLYVDWSLDDVLRGAEGAPSLERVEVLQPALFAVMVSLAELWRSYGVDPDLVIGHSQGEIAAAAVARALSLEDAARVSALRAQALAKLAGRGGMVAVSLPHKDLDGLLAQLEGEVSLAAVNGPASIVLSGSPNALQGLLEHCQASEIRAKKIAVDYASHSAQVEAIREELIEALAPITPTNSEIPLYSTLTGEQIDTTKLDGQYWYRSLRESVRFEQATRAAIEHGTSAFIEITPHPVLAMALAETIDSVATDDDNNDDDDDDPNRVAVIGSLRRDEGNAERFIASLAQAHTHGIEVDWETLYAERQSRRVELPTYPFERQRYWLDTPLSPGDLTSAGQAPAEHPLLAAKLSFAGDQGWIFTGRLSLRDQPWLRDHAVTGTPLLPASALVELALAVGAMVGVGAVEELTLERPLTLPELGSIDVQVVLSDWEECGRWQLRIYSRPQQSDGEDGLCDGGEEWTRHASGTLALGQAHASERVQAEESWPPAGAEPVDIDDLYERLAELGYEYGPAFQGLRAAWRRGEELFSEVCLDPEQDDQAGRFVAHPALFDGALHAVLAAALAEHVSGKELRLPFAFEGVRAQRAGAASWRVRVRPNGADSLCVQASDEQGNATLDVESLRTRALDRSRLDSAGGAEAPRLLALGWEEIAAVGVSESAVAEVEATRDALRALEQVPDVVICRVAPDQDGVGVIAGAHRLTSGVLEMLKLFLAEERFAAATLALVTDCAVAVTAGEAPSLIQAPLWGLVRTAQLEHPGRFLLIDSDDSDVSRQALRRGLHMGEPQVAIREGRLLTPRLARIQIARADQELPALDPNRTVLITGGTGLLGSVAARHLAETHGARRFILASRRGPAADGAKALRADLEAAGARVRIVACDVSQRYELEALIGTIPDDERLQVVIHAAGLLDDGVLSSLDGERIDRVLAPKLDTAMHLHDLTKDTDLGAFVLYSSAAATIGSPGQASYAAANAFLDALAQHRHASGLPARSIAWGLWQRSSEMTEHIDGAEEARLGGSGLSCEQGLELLDSACAQGEPAVVALALDLSGLRAQARAGLLPSLLRSLVRVPLRRGSELDGVLAQKLTELTGLERQKTVLEVVCAQAAAVLGHDSGEAIERDRAFKELGIDSLSAIDLRNRLASMIGLRLPATLVFDYPTCIALAGYICERLEGEQRGGPHTARRVRLDEPIAIVGMSCRYPGGVRSPQDLWELVASGTDAISSFPGDRGWDLERLFDHDPDHLGTTYASEGGFIADAGGFDASFFSISPRDALTMDPQQRLMLEAAWEALERAGIDPQALRGSRTGVFAGMMTYDYGSGSALAQRDGFDTASLGGSVTSGRVAYSFGFEGPAITVDTACSSSLVALHQACLALRSGECDLALAGGVTVLATPGMFLFFSRQRGLAPDGRCKPFSASADGAGFGEGVGLVLVERLSDAQAAGHHVLAVIRGSAVNQDGASNGLTAPNGPSQERVIREALANADLTPADVDAVEAHGTGTSLGDPIEAQALLSTYGQERRNGPLRLGSVKSNIGHTQGAAGIAGVIKMVEAIRHGTLPKSLHIDRPTPHVDWTEGQVKLLTESEPWPTNGHPRRAGISSFGASGTNAHVIIEQAPAQTDLLVAHDREQTGPPFATSVLPFVLTAKTEPALREQAQRLRTHLQAHPEIQPLDVAFTLATRRARLRQRAAVLCSDRDGLLAGLGALAGGEPAQSVVEGSAGAGPVAFMFTGQGAQRAGMGRDLYAAFPPFAEALDRQCTEFDRHLDRPLREVMFAQKGSPETDLLDRTEFTQPALFALEVALYRLLESLGVKPDLLIGHSIGELVAAHVAGVLSSPDAAMLVTVRVRLMGGLPDGGAMLAVEASEDEVLEGLDERLSVASVNGPRAVVVSGDEEAIEQFEISWSRRKRKTTRLRVSHAFHSKLMDPMLEEFRGLASSIGFEPPQIPIVSNLTGLVAGEEIATAEYWVAQARETVRFAEGIAALEASGVTRFVELGPDRVLSTMAHATLSQDTAQSALLTGTLRSRHGEIDSLLASLAETHTHGVQVNWAEFFAGRRAQPVDLPTYAFQHQRYWIEPSASTGDAPALGQSDAQTPLLGAAVRLANGRGWLLTGRISTQDHPWLRDHAVLGAPILPGACFVELALAAAQHIDAAMVEELTLEAPLVLDERESTQLQLVVGEPDAKGRCELSIYSREQASSLAGIEGEWTRNASGMLAQQEPAAITQPLRTEAWPPLGSHEADIERLYDALAGAGYEYGPAFQGLRRAWRCGEDLFGEVALESDQAKEAQSFCAHPALLDAAFHLMLVGGPTDHRHELVAPFSFRGIRLGASSEPSLRVRVRAADSGGLSLVAVDETGVEAISVESVIARPIVADQLRAPTRLARDSLFAVNWVQSPLPHSDGSPTRVAVLGDSGNLLGNESRIGLERYADLGALVEALDGPTNAPMVVLASACFQLEQAALSQQVRACTTLTLDLLKAWLAQERLAQAKLVLLTHRAVALGEDEPPELAAAALCGLVRSAQAEHPGRFALIDLDDSEASRAVLEQALISGEPQLALREGVAHVPRLGHLGAQDHAPARGLDRSGTVLITGGTGGLGAVLALHLAANEGVGHMLLVSRRGAEAEGASELRESLAQLGCEARIAACDAADRQALATLLASIPAAHPLTAVIHAAGVRDDGVITSLDSERMDRVLAAKVDGAIHLHELTEHLDLREFVLFSSIAATLGSPGQGNYAAANAALDALAVRRRSDGLVGLSLALGAWATPTGMTGTLRESDRGRWQRLGITPFTNEQGLETLELARAANIPFVVAVRLDAGALRAQSRAAGLPAVMSSLVSVRGSGVPERTGSLARALAGVPRSQWDTIVLKLVLSHVRAVLGHGASDTVDSARSFKELGFDSLAAVELRNVLSDVAGEPLPATLVFDYPTPVVLAGYLRSRATGAQPARLDQELDRLEALIASGAAENGERERIGSRLQALVARLAVGGHADARNASANEIQEATPDELYAMIDERLGGGPGSDG